MYALDTVLKVDIKEHTMSPVRLGEGRVRITLTLDEEVVELVDHVAAKCESNRAKVLSGLIEVGLDDWGMLSMIGFTPWRAKKLRVKLEKLGILPGEGTERAEKELAKERKQWRQRLGMSEQDW